MNKRKIVLIITLTLITLIIAAVVVFFYHENNKDTQTDIYARKLMDEYAPDIIVYGAIPKGFPDSVECRIISEITEESLKDEGNHDIHAVVIEDMNNQWQITDEEFLLLKQYVEEFGYDMHYAGKQYLETFVRLGFTVEIEEGECSLEYLGSPYIGENVQQNEYGNLYSMHGMIRDEYLVDVENVEEEVAFFILSSIYENAREVSGVSPEWENIDIIEE